MEGETILVRSNSWIDRLVVCKDCKHVAMDQERHTEHFKEARHINTLRSMAYRYKIGKHIVILGKMKACFLCQAFLSKYHSFKVL